MLALYALFICLPLSPSSVNVLPLTVVLITYAVGDAPQQLAAYLATPRDEQPETSA